MKLVNATFVDSLFPSTGNLNDLDSLDKYEQDTLLAEINVQDPTKWEDAPRYFSLLVNLKLLYPDLYATLGITATQIRDQIRSLQQQSYGNTAYFVMIGEFLFPGQVLTQVDYRELFRYLQSNESIHNEINTNIGFALPALNNKLHIRFLFPEQFESVEIPLEQQAAIFAEINNELVGNPTALGALVSNLRILYPSLFDQLPAKAAIVDYLKLYAQSMRDWGLLGQYLVLTHYIKVITAAKINLFPHHYEVIPPHQIITRASVPLALDLGS